MRSNVVRAFVVMLFALFLQSQRSEAAAPMITGFTPASGGAGASVTITGADFTGATNVKFNGLVASFTVDTSTQITASVPANATTGPISVITPGGTGTSATSFTVAPRITSFTPTSGPAGASVTINGANFTGATSVKFNGVAAATFTVNTPVKITATVPAGATTGTISVTTPAGTAISVGSLTVHLLPAISSLSPAFGAVGASVIINGANFTGISSVKFNGTSVTYTVNTSTKITTKVPTNATTGKITVTNPAGTGTSASDFIVAPRITSFTPTSAMAGTSVTITGVNLTGATAVMFNGVAASSFTVDTAIKITATVPSNATTGKISVTTPAGTATSTGTFKAIPAITGFSPTSGAAGVSVTLTGSGFTGASSVKFNGLAASFTVNSSLQITAAVPANATTGKITVTTAGGTATSTASFAVAPRITSFTPTSGLAGASVTISGANFIVGATTVGFNGTTASATVLSTISLTATVPAAATSGPISVTTAAGTGTSSSIFTVAVADTTAPAVPTGLTASTVSCSQNNLAWAASTDNPGGSGLKGYNVYKNGVFLRQVLAPATSTSDSGLAASTTLSYTVSAIDNASNESTRSADATATTPACPGAQTVWADRFGNTQEDRGQSVAINPSGNTVLTGHFRETVDFGGGPLTAHLYCLLGYCLPGTPSDILLAKYTPEGGHLWSKNIGGHSDDSGSAVAVDYLGDVLVTGMVGPNVDFGAGELPSGSGYDMFVAKYSGLDGSYRWARRLGSEGNDVFSNAIAVDSLGDVVVVGKFIGTVDFGRGPLTSAGDWDMFIAKYSGVDGTALWSKRLGGTQIDNGLGMAVDSHGDVVVTGLFYGVADFGGPAPLTSADALHSDIFLAKYRASDGAWLWSWQIGGTSNESGNAVAVDSADNILLTGSFTGTVNFGGPTSLSSAHPAGSEAFVAKYSASGGYIWAQRLGGVSFTGSSGTAIVADGSGNVAVTGKFQGTVNFGNGPLTSAGGNDIFVLKLPPAGGASLWSKRFGGPESTDGDYEKSFGLAAGPDGSTIVTGYFIGTTAFGADTYTSFGYGDIFLLHIGP